MSGTEQRAEDINDEMQQVRSMVDELLIHKTADSQSHILILCLMEAIEQISSGFNAGEMKECALSLACLSGAVAQNAIDAERREFDLAAQEVMQNLTMPKHN